MEDLYSKDFQLGSNTLKVDFLDTAGDDQVKVYKLPMAWSDRSTQILLYFDYGGDVFPSGVT